MKHQDKYIKKIIEEAEASLESKSAGMDKKSFAEAIRKFSTYGPSIYSSGALVNAVKEIKNLVESAEQLTLSETDQWFDNVTVSRHMKQLKESYKVFEKTAMEMNQLQQRLEACYEDIGRNLNNYWDVE